MFLSSFMSVALWASLTCSQGKSRGNGQKVSELLSSTSWELILSISLTCALCISENAVDHIKVFMNPVIFFPSPNVLVFLDVCQWCHSWMNNPWFPEFPQRAKLSNLCSSWNLKVKGNNLILIMILYIKWSLFKYFSFVNFSLH